MFRLSLWDVLESSLNPPTRWSSSLHVSITKERKSRMCQNSLTWRGCWIRFCFFVFLESVSHLPSLLVLLSNVTAFTRSRTSSQVLNPSQWARQTAPLPDKEIQLFNQESFNHQSLSTERKRKDLLMKNCLPVCRSTTKWQVVASSDPITDTQSGANRAPHRKIKMIHLERCLMWQWG